MNHRILLPLVFLGGSLLAQVTYDRLLHADREPQNWLTYSGDYASNRYSPLTQINRDNVKNLQLKWVYHPLYMKNEQTSPRWRTRRWWWTASCTPAPRSKSWRSMPSPAAVLEVSRPLDPKAYYNAYEVNKGMAIAGDTLFWATVDCHLIAIDTKTGRVIWDKAMAEWKKGYQFNVAPLVVRNMVILGPATNEAGANCWVGGLRRQHRQGDLALLHLAQFRGRSRRQDLGRRYLEARRQPHLERRHLRSGDQPHLLGHRQSQPRLER